MVGRGLERTRAKLTSAAISHAAKWRRENWKCSFQSWAGRVAEQRASWLTPLETRKINTALYTSSIHPSTSSTIYLVLSSAFSPLFISLQSPQGQTAACLFSCWATFFLPRETSHPKCVDWIWVIGINVIAARLFMSPKRQHYIQVLSVCDAPACLVLVAFSCVGKNCNHLNTPRLRWPLRIWARSRSCDHSDSNMFSF